MAHIRTKIVATIGPASESPEILRELIRAGCDVFRLNFSHGLHEEHLKRLNTIRQAEKELGEPVAVMADLCGPKIRVGTIAGGKVQLMAGRSITIQRQPIEGNDQRISTSLDELIDTAQPGQTILIDDGKILLEVERVNPPDEITCRIAVGGTMSSGKGVNLPHTNLSLSALTEKDIRDLEFITKHDFDYVALSFVRRPEDIQALRDRLNAASCPAHIVAKIEKPQALDHIRAIVELTDAVMVARGDLGVEMDLPAVPVVQKKIAWLCQRAGKPCIVATQMLESMTTCPTPTRAEVSDVANAVLDHTDAVMLSGETAVGKYPVETVGMMNRIVSEIQDFHDLTARPARVELTNAPTEAAIAAAVGEILAVDDISAVAVFSATGATARMLAKHRLSKPILGLSPDLRAVRRMCLYYGVSAVAVQTPRHTGDVLELATQLALKLGMAEPGQKMVVVTGRPIGKPGAANSLVIHQIPAPA
ncbi:MAG: pyruvate kinase [Planctomycetes bacterium]|nr:pyruvate kinase [Planctomycetota bacterium]